VFFTIRFNPIYQSNHKDSVKLVTQTMVKKFFFRILTTIDVLNRRSMKARLRIDATKKASLLRATYLPTSSSTDNKINDNQGILSTKTTLSSILSSQNFNQ
jgi:hypothetical protein